MNTWLEMAQSSYDASKRLQMTGHWRSSVSRAYYAAYAAVTAELEGMKGVTFSHGGNNPSHMQLRELVEDHLPRRKFSLVNKRKVKRSINALYKARSEADYMPNRTFSKTDASDALREAGLIFQILGMKP